MKLETADQAHDLINARFANPKTRLRIERTEGGKYVSPGFRLEGGMDEDIFRLGRDGRWRWAFHNIYGNTGHVHGPATDASGFVITDGDLLEAFDSIAVWTPYQPS